MTRNCKRKGRREKQAQTPLHPSNSDKASRNLTPFLPVHSENHQDQSWGIAIGSQPTWLERSCSLREDIMISKGSSFRELTSISTN
eukprot:1141960-Pelagomonas_calceolata.AAC.4